MSAVSGGFFDEVKSFVENHKVLCIATLGLAVIGYSIGNLAGRAVSWIGECTGTTKKTDDVSREVLSSSKETGFAKPRSSEPLLQDHEKLTSKAIIEELPDNIGIKTLGINSASQVSGIEVPEKTDLLGIARVNQYIDSLKKSDFYSGVVLVAVGNKIVRQETIMPEKLEQRPFTQETPFNILSVGKLFTTVAIMQLVENEDISLDQPINQLLELDDYTLKDCDETYAKGKLNKSDLEAFMSDKNITIRHLLTHTAGLVEGHNAPTSYDPTKVGKKYIYSNLGFQLLARIVAKKADMPFVDYVRDHIMKTSGIEEEGSIRYLEHPPGRKEQPNQFSNNRPSGVVEEVEKGEHRIPSPDGNGCFWMTASDLFKFASAFANNKLFKDPLSKEVLLTKDERFANRALGFQIDGDGSKENPRMMIHPGSELGASSGLCIIEGQEPITLICLSNFSEGNWALPGMWNAVLKEDFEQPFSANEKLRTQYQTLLSLSADDSEGIQKITAEIEPRFLVGVLIELEESGHSDLIPSIVAGLTSSNIDEVAMGLAEAGNQSLLELVRKAQQSTRF